MNIERSRREKLPIEAFTVRVSAEPHKVVPQCKDCEQLAKIREIVKNHAEWEKDYFTAILAALELQKDAFEDKNYQQAEKLLDELIADLKTDKKA